MFCARSELEKVESILSESRIQLKIANILQISVLRLIAEASLLKIKKEKVEIHLA